MALTVTKTTLEESARSLAALEDDTRAAVAFLSQEAARTLREVKEQVREARREIADKALSAIGSVSGEALQSLDTSTRALQAACEQVFRLERRVASGMGQQRVSLHIQAGFPESASSVKPL